MWAHATGSGQGGLGAAHLMFGAAVVQDGLLVNFRICVLPPWILLALEARLLEREARRLAIRERSFGRHAFCQRRQCGW